MTNNDIFKKLRVALQLRDDQIVEILELVDFRVSKSELGNIFRNEDHPNYVPCGDQLLRNFLNALVIKLRGTKEHPKNANEELSKIAQAKINIFSSNTSTNKITSSNDNKVSHKGLLKEFSGKKKDVKVSLKEPKTTTKTTTKATKTSKSKDFKPKKIQVIEKVKFKNGKLKSK